MAFYYTHWNDKVVPRKGERDRKVWSKMRVDSLALLNVCYASAAFSFLHTVDDQSVNVPFSNKCCTVYYISNLNLLSNIIETRKFRESMVFFLLHPNNGLDFRRQFCLALNLRIVFKSLVKIQKMTNERLQRRMQI